MKPSPNKLLSPLSIAFNFQIKRERLQELRTAGSFPEPDRLRVVSSSAVMVPYWRYEVVSKFLEDHPEEDNRRDYHRCIESDDQA